eukprot:1137364-Pelagomonas_calceolata.AAC.3
MDGAGGGTSAALKGASPAGSTCAKKASALPWQPENCQGPGRGVSTKAQGMEGNPNLRQRLACSLTWLPRPRV